MKRLLLALGFCLAATENAAAQASTAIGTEYRAGRLVGVVWEAGRGGITLDAGAPVESGQGNRTFSHVPPRSVWVVELPAIVTVEGTRQVRLSCSVTGGAVVASGFGAGPVAGQVIGSAEYTFETGGPFMGRLVLGIPSFAGDQSRFGFVFCRAVVFGTRNGVDWRAFENQPTEGGLPAGEGVVAQYVLESDNSRLITGVNFRAQVVLTTVGGYPAQ